VRREAFNSFDYGQALGWPEVALRVELVRERLAAGGRVLEVGLGTGEMTAMALELGAEVTCVDPDEQKWASCRERLGREQAARVRFIGARIEEAELPAKGFEQVLLQNILEHLPAPTAVLRNLTACLAEGGLMHICVPLAHSLHRRLAAAMGLLRECTELAESDIRFGHYRVYTPDLLRGHVGEAGLRIRYERPFYLKPLPTAQLNDLPIEMHRGLMRLGEELPELAAYLYVEAGR